MRDLIYKHFYLLQYLFANTIIAVPCWNSSISDFTIVPLQLNLFILYNNKHGREVCRARGGTCPPPQFFLKIGKIYRRAPPPDFGHDH